MQQKEQTTDTCKNKEERYKTDCMVPFPLSSRRGKLSLNN